MNLVQLAQSISISIAAVGVVAAGLGYLWSQIFVGRNKATTEDYNLLNIRLNSLQKICDDQQRELAELHQQVGRLQGVSDEKEKKIQDLTALLQNRDPGLTEYIKFSRETTAAFQMIVKKMNDDLEEIKANVRKITGKREGD